MCTQIEPKLAKARVSKTWVRSTPDIRQSRQLRSRPKYTTLRTTTRSSSPITIIHKHHVQLVHIPHRPQLMAVNTAITIFTLRVLKCRNSFNIRLIPIRLMFLRCFPSRCTLRESLVATLADIRGVDFRTIAEIVELICMCYVLLCRLWFLSRDMNIS